MADLKPTDLEPKVQTTKVPNGAAEPPVVSAAEPEGKEYTVKPGCAIEHSGIRYEGSEKEPVKVKLTDADAEVHKANLE
jgi:hypothetical protein